MKNIFILFLFLHFAVYGFGKSGLKPKYKDVVKIGNLKKVSKIIENIDDINSTFNDGSTMLIVSSKYGHFDITKLLIEKGANVNAQDNRGVSALLPTVVDGHLEVAKLLIENGANTNLKDNIGRSPLLGASSYGYKEIVILLKNNGAVGLKGQNDSDFECFGFRQLKKGMTMKQVSTLTGTPFWGVNMDDENTFKYASNHYYIFDSRGLVDWKHPHCN